MTDSPSRARGQVSFEYLAVLGLMLLVLAPTVLFTVQASAAAKVTNDAEVAVAKMASTAESVYSHGPGARQVVSINLPDGSDLSGSSISGRIVNLKVYTAGGRLHDATRLLDFNVTGSFPSTPGNKRMEIEALSDGSVRIREALVS